MAKANRIPKKVAGISVPKAVRKSPLLRSLLGSEAGRQMLGQALIAGATAAAGVLAARSETAADAGGSLKKTSQNVGGVAKDAIQSATGAIADVIGDAARSVLPKDGRRKATARARASSPSYKGSRAHH